MITTTLQRQLGMGLWYWRHTSIHVLFVLYISRYLKKLWEYKRCLCLELNQGPWVCKTHVITTTLQRHIVNGQIYVYSKVNIEIKWNECVMYFSYVSSNLWILITAYHNLIISIVVPILYSTLIDRFPHYILHHTPCVCLCAW